MQLNQSLPYKIITNLNQLLNAIEKATILLTTEKKPTIHLSIIQNTLKISARSTEYGSTFEEITIDNINNLPQTNFTFNAKYLITLLKNIESESVIIEFSSSNKPVFIKQDNSQDYTSLILPIVGF
jgi:DNA polymerase-3 subunit beta